jgi:membrane protein YdbS with pleckstrin-like domain
LAVADSIEKPVSDATCHTCPLCGGKIDDNAREVKVACRRIRFAAALIPIGVIMAVGGEMLAYYAHAWASWGHGLMGAGIVAALLSALFVKMLD